MLLVLNEMESVLPALFVKEECRQSLDVCCEIHASTGCCDDARE